MPNTGGVQDDDLIGVSRERAAEIAQISVRRVQAWANRGLVKPQVVRAVSDRKVVRLYGFQQLLELLIVRQLEDADVHIRHIGVIVQRVRSAEPGHALSQLGWAVVGGKVFVQYPDGRWSPGLDPAQEMLDGVIPLTEYRLQIRDRLKVKRAEGQIERRRGIRQSKPVFAGTATPVDAVRPYLERGIATGEILEAFPQLTARDIDAARKEIGAA